MFLEGFTETRTIGRDGGEDVEYRPDWRKSGTLLHLRKSPDGQFVVRYLENGRIPGVSPGERVSSPVDDPGLADRVLRAMAVHHFDAAWLSDFYTEMDSRLIRKGFEIGSLSNGKTVWVQNRFNTRVIVERKDAPRIPSSPTDPTTMLLKGAMDGTLRVESADFEALLDFIDGDHHFKLFNAGRETLVASVFSVVGGPVH